MRVVGWGGGRTSLPRGTPSRRTRRTTSTPCTPLRDPNQPSLPLPCLPHKERNSLAPTLTTAHATPTTVAAFPAAARSAFAASSARSSGGFALSSAYAAPHCGHLRALRARAGSCCADFIHWRRHDSWATSVQAQGCVHGRAGDSGSVGGGGDGSIGCERGGARGDGGRLTVVAFLLAADVAELDLGDGEYVGRWIMGDDACVRGGRSRSAPTGAQPEPALAPSFAARRGREQARGDKERRGAVVVDATEQVRTAEARIAKVERRTRAHGDAPTDTHKRSPSPDNHIFIRLRSELHDDRC